MNRVSIETVRFWYINIIDVVFFFNNTFGKIFREDNLPKIFVCGIGLVIVVALLFHSPVPH